MNKYCNPFGEPTKTNKYLGLSIMLLWIIGWTTVLLLRAIVYMVTASILIV